jgi:putative hydrolase of the HAD superfamily
MGGSTARARRGDRALPEAHARFATRQKPGEMRSISPGEIGVPRFELGTSPTRTERATRLRHTPDSGIGYRRSVLRAILFDVDFTLARPGPELGPEGYVRAGERHGLRLEADRYDGARDAALVELRRHPELEHDDEIWFRFTERIVRGMGGDGESAYDCAVEITRGWERHENFQLYDDALPALAALRTAGLLIGLVSNSARDVHEFARHHRLEIDAGISSFHHGKTKPHASIFRAVLDLLGVAPAEAAMVGDTIADDVEGARALGMRAILLDREHRHPAFEPRIESLRELPGLLELDP